MVITGAIISSLVPLLRIPILAAIILPSLLMLCICVSILKTNFYIIFNLHQIYTYIKNSGQHINLLTNIRIINCNYRPRKFARVTSIPYGLIDKIETTDDTISFIVNVVRNGEIAV